MRFVHALQFTVGITVDRRYLYVYKSWLKVFFCYFLIDFGILFFFSIIILNIILV